MSPETRARAIALCVDGPLNFGETVVVLKAEGHHATVQEIDRLWLAERKRRAKEAR